MRLFVSLFAISLSFCGIAQSVDYPLNDNGEIVFTEIVSLSMNKDKLYGMSKEWVAKTFGDYKSVIQYEDPINYKLVVKAFSEVPYVFTNKYETTLEKINYTISIECKENKIRYIV